LLAATHTTNHNEIGAEVVAVQTELGTNPKGIYVNVGARLDALAAAIPPSTHTQNTDVGTSSATFYMNGASGAKIKEVGGAYAVRNNADNAYVDFTCDDLVCSTINGITSVQLAAIQTNSHTHSNQVLLDSYTQTEVNLASAVSLKHTQNTDTGSTSETFQLNNGNVASAKIKVDDLTPTFVDIRNGADSAWADIKALGFRGPLVQDVVDDGTRPGVRYAVGNYWEFSNDGVSYSPIGASGLSLGGSAGNVQYHGGANLAGEAAFTYDAGTNTLTVENVTVTGTLTGGYIDSIADTASVDLTVAVGQLTATVLPAGVDHNSLNNYSANRHIDHTAVSISTSTGLTGGGDISATRTLSLSHLGIESLADPNADRIIFWDDSATATAWLTVSTGLDVTGTTLTNSDTGSAAVTAHNIAYDHTQLHVAATVLDTASIDFGLTGQQITGSVLPAGVDHDSLNNYSANRHIDHTAVSISAGTGLTGGGDISATRTLSLSHLGIQSLTDPGAHRLMAWDDTDGYVNWVTIGTGLTYTQATHTLTAAGGATLTRATFTNASLTAGVLTITHSAGLSAPYTVMVTIFDNNYQQIIPDSITGATNSVAVDLSSYVTAGGGSISGTWGYGYIA
jgi:hypothetical protein